MRRLSRKIRAGKDKCRIVLLPVAFGRRLLRFIPFVGAGSELPEGLRLTEDGYIVGTPAETYDSVITVIASSPFAESVSAEFGLKVGLGISPFLSSALADGKVGEGYYANVDNTGGAASVSYAIKDGSALPEGLTLSVSGEISGAPTEAGCWQFTVVASADGAISDEKQFTIYVYEPAGSVTVRVPDPDGAIGRAQEFGATLGIVGIALGAAGLAVGIAATVVASVRGRRKK